MLHDPVAAVLDWETQQRDFEGDGALRDIYVQATTTADWKVVLALILDGNFQARLERGGALVPVPIEFETLFDDNDNDRHLLSFTIADVVLSCQFFQPEEIELSFLPNGVTEDALQHVLAFIVDIGEATRKPVIMTPENYPQAPIFRYEPDEHQLTWIPPVENRN
ncbi:MAG: hypothetical protein M3680_12035 [Myxococcota bacterium]|nr:hypothetical protein [Myxococcota bacterium]